jgi:flagellar hook assembly protein FlgD
MPGDVTIRVTVHAVGDTVTFNDSDISRFRVSGSRLAAFSSQSSGISYELRTASRVNVKVFDVTGRLVANIADGWQEAGTHEATFDGSNLASGVYLYTLTAGTNHASGKMVLLK